VNLKNIGFYTLSDERVKNASSKSPLSRCELILTSRCNFRCPYCRRVGGRDLPYEDAIHVVDLWATQGLKAIRFSGGEPTLYEKIVDLIKHTKDRGIERIAISTNGSATKDLYQKLIDAGVNDFSVSLDACCASTGDTMAGGIKGSWNTVVENIRWLSQKVYVTVGIVLTEENESSVNDTINFAHSLGVADIRVIPAAQCDTKLRNLNLPKNIIEHNKILKYRIDRANKGLSVRGLTEKDSNRCALVLDDMAVCEGKHYPCIIYMREGGQPIGNIGPNTREERNKWSETHNCKSDHICKNNCLDVCVDYNNKYAEMHKELKTPRTFAANNAYIKFRNTIISPLDEYLCNPSTEE